MIITIIDPITITDSSTKWEEKVKHVYYSLLKLQRLFQFSNVQLVGQSSTNPKVGGSTPSSSDSWHMSKPIDA